MSHRKCCRRDFDRCGCGFGGGFGGGFGNSGIVILIIILLLCNGGRRFC